MMVKKPKSMTEKPPPHTDEIAPDDAGRQRSARDRPRPVEPFEECGPSGGYGGAGTDEDAKDD
jgi:hypothetical protein